MDFLQRTWAEIDIDALAHNFNILRNEAKNAELMAVVKANAYGHSDKDIAPLLEEMGADSFAVSNIEEALRLREQGITKPILILGYTPVNMAKALYDNNITQCVYSKEYAQVLSEIAAKLGISIKIHIKLDTGMGRLGFDCRDSLLSGIEEAIECAKLPGFYFEGLFTHFAFSDRSPKEDDGFTDEQYSRFCVALNRFKNNGLTPKYCHCCNSAAFSLDPDKHFDLCRLGIMLYGLTPSASLNLKEKITPVMTVCSVVSMVKDIKEGDTVSYGRTFKATRDMKIATISAGYADGYPRALSNKGYVLINGKEAPIVGRICMDQFSVDISHIDNVALGDKAILFGKELPVEKLADMCGTINYEIVCGISSRVPRIVTSEKLKR